MTRLISLLVSVTAVVLFATPGFAQSPTYTWDVSCSKAEALGPNASWFWTNNGHVISAIDPAASGGSVGCGASQKAPAVIPDFIDTPTGPMQVNGIQVDLFIQNGCCFCFGSSMITKSFSPSDPKFNITDSVSGPKTATDGFGNKVTCPYASASLKFNIQSN
jgi:hypothetical protein